MVGLSSDPTSAFLVTSALSMANQNDPAQATKVPGIRKAHPLEQKHEASAPVGVEGRSSRFMMAYISEPSRTIPHIVFGNRH